MKQMEDLAYCVRYLVAERFGVKKAREMASSLEGDERAEPRHPLRIGGKINELGSLVPAEVAHGLETFGWNCWVKFGSYIPKFNYSRSILLNVFVVEYGFIAYFW